MSLQPPLPDPAAELAPTGVISATEPVPGEAPASPPPTKRTLPGLMGVSLALFATYAGLIAILLPIQVALIDEANKVANLAIIVTTSFVFTLFAQPIVGAISDRTRSRFGRRAPWMVGGALIGGVLLFGMGYLDSILWLTVFWVLIQVSLNALQGPMSAITPDRFPRDRRGVASAVFGLGMQIGATLGIVIAGQFATNFGVGYSVFGVIVIVVTIAYVVIDRDWSSKEATVAPWSWKQFLGGFWINPRRHPDFAWAFTARFLFMLGYFVISAYGLYILTDYIGMSLTEAASSQVTLTLAGLVPTLLAVAVSGWWSDRVGRRKVFIYASSAIMVASLAFPLLMPNMTGMLLMNVIIGFGFGFYMSVDTALMTEVLPGGGTNAGKDLGILNIATNIPQAMSAAVAGLIISSLGGYPMLFVFAMVFVLIAAIAVSPIKSVR
ncbi:Na+/melibiose symporter [Agromyces sp. CF514]|uniref:MFS transporter n=1 Tax=Agromyces sp. CF514 TaxID=1881031 RepID=UPI0008E34503|nr:MFS transporter [Agromyces sp. CF514]SFR68464.1 Na+/melibiose symporter [Agromyces sp. CF514]